MQEYTARPAREDTARPAREETRSIKEKNSGK